MRNSPSPYTPAKHPLASSPKQKSFSLGQGFQQLDSREMPSVTTLADAFQPGGNDQWSASTLHGDANEPLGNFQPDFLGTGNSELVGAEGAGRLDTVTVNPSYHLDVINGGTTLRIAYNDFQPNSPYRLWWDNGGRPESLALSGSGVVTYRMPWHENLATGSLSIANGGINNPIAVPTSVQFRQGTVRHMFWTNGGGNGSVVSADRSFPQASYNTQREIRNTALLVGANRGASEIQTPISIPWKPGEVIVRPGYNQPVKLQWRSPEVGVVTLRTVFKDVEPLVGDGVTYTLGHTKAEFQTYPPGFVGPKELKTRTEILDEGLIRNGELKDVAFGGKQILVNEGDTLFIILSPSGTQNDLSKSDGDATDIDLSIKLDPFPKNLYRKEGDLLESEAVIPKVQMWSTGTQITMKYDDIPDMGVDVRLGTVMNQHLPEGSGIVTYDLPNIFNGDPQAQGNLRVERSDTHVSIIKTLQIDMAGGYGTALRAMTPPTEAIPLLSLAWSRLIVTTPVQIQAGLRGELQALLDGRPSIRETPNVASMSKLSLLDRVVMTQTMSGLGGQSTVTVWKGPHAPGNAMETMSASAWNQMYSRLKALQLNPAPSLVQQLQLPPGPILFRPQMPAYQKVFAFPGIGNVTVISDPGHTPPGYQYPVFEHGMGVTNGVLSTMDIGFPTNAPVTMNRVGRENLQFVLPGTTYVRSIAVEYIGGEHMGGLSYTRADGTTKSLTLTSSGEIPVNDAITGFTIAPGERGAWGIKGISVAPVKTQRAVTPSQIWQVTGSALSLDVSQSQTLVSRVSGRITSERPNDGVTVYAMRGQERIQTAYVSTDGTFLFEDTKGITGILVTHSDAGGNLAVSDVSIEGNRGALPLNMEAISPKTNGILCDVIKPEFDTGVSWNMNAALQQYNFCNPGVITSANPVSVLRLVENDSSKYAFQRIVGTNGGTIDQVLALTERGLIEVPPQLYMRLGSNGIVTFKGCPHFLAFRMTFHGTVTEVGAGRIGDKFEDAVPPEVLTPKLQILALTNQPVNIPGFGDPILQINQGANAQLMPGGLVGLRAQVTNEGLGGGPVTVKVYCGYNGDERDVLQGSFTTDFGGTQIKSISCTVGAPRGSIDMRPIITIICETANGQVRTGWTAPIYPRSEYQVYDPIKKAWITIVPKPTLAQAMENYRTAYLHQIAARAASDPRLANYSASVQTAFQDLQDARARDQEQTFLALNPRPTYSAPGIPTPTQTAIDGMNVNSQHGPYAGPILAYNGSGPLLPNDQLDRLISMANSIQWNQDLYKKVTDWYTGNRANILGLTDATPVNESVAQGRLFLALLQKTQNELDPANFLAFTNDLADFSWVLRVGVTDMTRDGLNISALSQALRGIDPYPDTSPSVTETNPDKRRVELVKKLFIIGQMGNIFNGSSAASAILSDLRTNKSVGGVPGNAPLDVYRSAANGNYAADEYVVVRFNAMHSSSAPFQNAKIYLKDVNGNRISGALNVYSMGNLSLKIPLSAITAFMTPDQIQNPGRNFYADPVTGRARNMFILELEGFPAANATQGIKIQSEQKIIVEVPTFMDLSTNTNLPQHNIENRVLNVLLNTNTLYTDNISGWKWNIASDYHRGAAEYAIDLIKDGISGDNTPVKIPDAGKVVWNQQDHSGNSTVVIEHTMQTGSQTIYWYTKYLHMNINSAGLVYILGPGNEQIALTEGTLLAKSGTVGYAGSVGINSTGPHIHEETIIPLDGRQLAHGDYFGTKSIDQRKLLLSEKLHVPAVATSVVNGFAEGPRQMPVVWNSDVYNFVNTTYNLVYDRRELEDGSGSNNSYWRAFEGTDISQMKRVVNMPIDPNGHTGWVRVNENGSIYRENNMAKLWTLNSVQPWQDISI